MREDLEELEKLATPLDSASPANAHRNTRARETEGRGGVCSRNNLHASPFGTFDVSGFSKRGYIVANIEETEKEKRRRRRGWCSCEESFTLSWAKFAVSASGNWNRAGPSVIVTSLAGFDPSHDWSWKLASFLHSTLSDDREGSFSSSDWFENSFAPSFFFLSASKNFSTNVPRILLDFFSLLSLFFCQN